MTAVNVNLAVGSAWSSACRAAVQSLNRIFQQNGVGVTLSVGGPAAQNPTIKVSIDASIGKTTVHGKTRATTTTDGQLLEAEVGLPNEVVVSTPGGLRPAGPGLLQVIAAHELVHALNHPPHNTHLMARTLRVSAGDRPAGDKLQADRVLMPPIQLSPESIAHLKHLWP